VSRGTLLMVLVLGALRDPCGTDTSTVGLNAPCTRSSDCENGLACLGGVCTPTESGVASDGGSDANDASARDGDTAE